MTQMACRALIAGLFGWLLLGIVGSAFASSNGPALPWEALKSSHCLGHDDADVAAAVSTGNLDCLFHQLYDHGAGFAGIESGRSQASTYGEVTSVGVAQLLAALPNGVSSEDVFIDLGSGVGKVVLQAFLASSLQRAVGVEIEGDRHRHGQRALAHLAELVSATGATFEEAGKMVALHTEGRSLQLLHEDALSTDIDGASIVFMMNLAFPEALHRALQHRIISELPPGTFVTSGLKFPGCHPRLMHVGRVDVSVSWKTNTVVHLYMVTPSGEGPSPTQTSVGGSAVPWRRLELALGADRDKVMQHHQQGDETSVVECDVNELEALLQFAPDEAAAKLKAVASPAKVDFAGQTLLHVLSDKHCTSLRAVSTFGGGSNTRGIGGFAEAQARKRDRLLRLIELTLDNGADVNLLDKAGETALDIAMQKGNSALMTLLEARGARRSSRLAAEL